MSRAGSVPVAGAALGVCLVALGGVLRWPVTAVFSQPGYVHGPYLAVAPFAVLSLVLTMTRPGERTGLFSMGTGLVVAATAKADLWGGGRYYALVGGVLMLLAGGVQYFHYPKYDVGEISVRASLPSRGGLITFVGSLLLGIAIVVGNLGPRSDWIDVAGSVLLAGTVVAAGAAVGLYWWGPDFGAAVAVTLAILFTLFPGLLVSFVEGPVFAIAAILVVVPGWVAAALIAVAYRTIPGLDSLADPAVTGRPFGEDGWRFAIPRLRSLSFLPVVAGFVAVLVAGSLRWHVESPGLTYVIPRPGVRLVEYYSILSIALAAIVLGLLRRTRRMAVVTVGMGILCVLLAAGENPLTGGRLVAGVGGSLIAVGGLLAERDGRDGQVAAIVGE